MQRISTRRVIWGGLLAGLIINVGQFFLNDSLVYAKRQWGPKYLIIPSFNLHQPSATAYVLFIVAGFITGLLLIWLYAATKPTLGDSPGSALVIGLITWASGCTFSIVPLMLLQILPDALWGRLLGWYAIELPLAAVIGSRVYKDKQTH